MNANRSVDLGDAVSKTLEDAGNLEVQIRHLLKTMEMAEIIENVQALTLAEPESLKVGNKPEVQMKWRDPDEPKRQGKGKTFPNSKVEGTGGNIHDELSKLESMEICIKNDASKYVPLEDSIFFVPVLDRCIFGMTLLNVAEIKLRKPKITLSILSSSDSNSNTHCSFQYDVQTFVNDVNPEKVEKSRPAAGVAFQDTVSSISSQQCVVPGCEVLITASFAYQYVALQDSDCFNLLISVTLDGKELWARQIPTSINHFHAPYIDFVFKNHHLSILNAFGTHIETFKLERVLLQDEKSPFRSMQKFLLPLGYENIASRKIGSDTTIEIYTTNQPSLLWGTCFKIEKCSKKPTLLRCLLTTRTKEQMQYLSKQFGEWLKREVVADRKSGLPVLTVSTENTSNTCIRIQDKLESEIQLILKLQQLKNSSTKGRDSAGTGRLKQIGCNIADADSNWIREYINIITETDYTFVQYM